MEAKAVIMTVLLLSLVMGRIQVEAKSCCQTTTARNIYNTCRLAGGSQEFCAKTSGCKHVDGKCPPGWEKDIPENSGDVVNKYCKLGCVSSVCGAISTLQYFDATEIVNGGVEQCTKGCSAICTKGSITALEIA